MSLPAKVSFPNNLISTSVYNFSQVITSWNNLSASTQAIWDVYASLNQLRDKSGNLRTVSGFSLFLQSNVHLYSIGLQSSTLPVQPAGADVLPAFDIIAYSNSLHIDFFPAISFPNSEMVIFATAPYVIGSVITHRALNYIGSFPAPSAGIFDITAAYESSLFINWPTFFNAHDFEITFYIALINSVTHIASQFYIKAWSVANAPEVDWANYANNIQSLNFGLGSKAWFGLGFNDNGIILIGNTTDKTVHKSTDFGQSFTSIGNLGTTTTKNAFWLDNTNYALVILATNGTRYYSANASVPFTNFGAALTGIAPAGINLGLNGRIFLNGTLQDRVFYSDDLGLSFTAVALPAGSGVSYVLKHLENGIILIWCSGTSALYRSTDNGLTWAKVLQEAATHNVLSIAYCGNGVVFLSVANFGYCYISLDYGLSFSVVNISAIDTSFPVVVYIGGSLLVAISYPNYKLMQSLDFGINWTYVKPSGFSAVPRFVAKFGKSSCFFLPGTGATYLAG